MNTGSDAAATAWGDLPKVCVVASFHDGPHGGANQFLKALKIAFERLGAFAESATEAKVVLFNSHHDINRVVRARGRNREAVFIHRVDGPMRLYNDPTDRRDSIVTKANRELADGTIFQSEWSRRVNEELGFKPASPIAVIGNAADPRIFNRERARQPLSGPRVRLVAVSWSTNPNKGFDIYGYLDRHLDFTRFEMLFVGNSPIRFANINHVPPCSSAEVAKYLKDSDVFIAPSRFESCPNTLIEALACGLPAVARGGSSQAEVLRGGGEIFAEDREILPLIERVASHYGEYVERIELPTLDEIASRYLVFAKELVLASRDGASRPKKGGWLKRLRLLGRD